MFYSPNPLQWRTAFLTSLTTRVVIPSDTCDACRRRRHRMRKQRRAMARTAERGDNVWVGLTALYGDFGVVYNSQVVRCRDGKNSL